MGKNNGLPTISNSAAATCRAAQSAKSKPAPTCMIEIDHVSTAPNASGPNSSRPNTPYKSTGSSAELEDRRCELGAVVSASGSEEVTGHLPWVVPESGGHGPGEHRQSTACHESHFRQALAGFEGPRVLYRDRCQMPPLPASRNSRP